MIWEIYSQVVSGGSDFENATCIVMIKMAQVRLLEMFAIINILILEVCFGNQNGTSVTTISYSTTHPIESTANDDTKEKEDCNEMIDGVEDFFKEIGCIIKNDKQQLMFFFAGFMTSLLICSMCCFMSKCKLCKKKNSLEDDHEKDDTETHLLEENQTSEILQSNGIYAYSDNETLNRSRPKFSNRQSYDFVDHNRAKSSDLTENDIPNPYTHVTIGMEVTEYDSAFHVKRRSIPEDPTYSHVQKLHTEENNVDSPTRFKIVPDSNDSKSQKISTETKPDKQPIYSDIKKVYKEKRRVDKSEAKKSTEQKKKKRHRKPKHQKEKLDAVSNEIQLTNHSKEEVHFEFGEEEEVTKAVGDYYLIERKAEDEANITVDTNLDSNDDRLQNQILKKDSMDEEDQQESYKIEQTIQDDHTTVINNPEPINLEGSDALITDMVDSDIYTNISTDFTKIDDKLKIECKNIEIENAFPSCIKEMSLPTERDQSFEKDFGAVGENLDQNTESTTVPLFEESDQIERQKSIDKINFDEEWRCYNVEKRSLDIPNDFIEHYEDKGSIEPSSLCHVTESSSKQDEDRSALALLLGLNDSSDNYCFDFNQSDDESMNITAFKTNECSDDTSEKSSGNSNDEETVSLCIQRVKDSPTLALNFTYEDVFIDSGKIFVDDQLVSDASINV